MLGRSKAPRAASDCAFEKLVWDKGEGDADPL
jgi:hypothetical protein